MWILRERCFLDVIWTSSCPESSAHLLARKNMSGKKKRKKKTFWWSGSEKQRQRSNQYLKNIYKRVLSFVECIMAPVRYGKATLLDQHLNCPIHFSSLFVRNHTPGSFLYPSSAQFFIIFTVCDHIKKMVSQSSFRTDLLYYSSTVLSASAVSDIWRFSRSNWIQPWAIRFDLKTSLSRRIDHRPLFQFKVDLCESGDKMIHSTWWNL